MTAAQRIHPSSFIGADVTVAPDAVIGPNCCVEGKIIIGARTRLVGGVILVGDAIIGEGCVIEPGVSMTGMLSLLETDARPLALEAGVRVGAGSVLAHGVTIGSGSRIDAGTVVVRNVPSHAIVRGNPAAIVGYTTAGSSAASQLSTPEKDARRTVVADSAVAGVKLYRFPRIRDLRGDLSVGEFGRNVPFTPKRYFLVFDVPSAETRGEHAHRQCEQFLICVSGKLTVIVDDGRNREEIELDVPNIGLYIPPRIWGVQYKYEPTTVLLVFASHFYDPGDYIRDYDRFLAEYGSTA